MIDYKKLVEEISKRYLYNTDISKEQFIGNELNRVQDTHNSLTTCYDKLDDLRENYEQDREELLKELKMIQGRCTHYSKQYEYGPDGGQYICDICGKII